MDAIAEPTRQLVRMRGRSYVAFVFCPVVPIVGWLEEIDATLARSPGFFVGKPVVLDLSAVDLSQSAIAHLVTSLEQRNIRVLGIEGVDAAHVTTSMPPLLTGGRHCVLTQSEPRKARSQTETDVSAARKPGALRSVGRLYRRRRDRAGFGRLRRGNRRRRFHPYLRSASRPGDGGRQRQLRPRGSICQKIEAELLAIDGYYQTAEEIDAIAAQSAGPGMARRRHHENHTAELTG